MGSYIQFQLHPKTWPHFFPFKDILCFTRYTEIPEQNKERIHSSQQMIVKKSFKKALESFTSILHFCCCQFYETRLYIYRYVFD